eukprot:snap_masked-scaffold_14-processed-gene-2.40-mRNA-1 protein AED:1.00 eAED:1.00 QI:0/0/0/0/1/1/2/0/61
MYLSYSTIFSDFEVRCVLFRDSKKKGLSISKGLLNYNGLWKGITFRMRLLYYFPMGILGKS